MSRTSKSLTIVVLAVIVIASAVALIRLQERDAVSLAELAAVEDARVELDAGEGDYPVFDDERVLVRTVSLADDARVSITPPFPSRMTFALDVPRAGALDLATALVMMQQVERARVRFTVSLVADGETAVVLDEVRTIADANRWLPAHVDLSAWTGRRVTLALEAGPDPGPRDVAWRNRVQIVWGDAVVREAQAPSGSTDTLDWLRERVAAWGGDSPEVVSLTRYGANLTLAGLASLFVAFAYRLLGTGGAPRGFNRSLVTFTLTTTFVIAVLRSSIALSLGLLGALSILRFRAPVRTSEQLFGLLTGVAIALAFGTDQGLLAVVAVAAFVVVLLVWRSSGARRGTKRFFVTASGPVSMDASDTDVVDRLEAIVGGSSLESFDVVGGELRLRAKLELDGASEIVHFAARLRRELPEFRISFETTSDAWGGAT